jgi:hypothetical protein
MAKIKKLFYITYMLLRWKLFGLEGITWGEFKKLFHKEFCSNSTCNASK